MFYVVYLGHVFLKSSIVISYHNINKLATYLLAYSLSACMRVCAVSASSNAESDPSDAETLGRASVGLSVAGIFSSILTVIVVVLVTTTNITTSASGVILVIVLVLTGSYITCRLSSCAYKYLGTCR